MAGTGYNTGGMNTGQPQVGAGTGGHTGMLHPGGVSNVNQAPAMPVGNRNHAPVAETTRQHDVYDHDQHDEEETTIAGAGAHSKKGKAVNAMARTILGLLTLLQLLAFFVVLGGLSALQHRANNLNLTQQRTTAYNTVFIAGDQVPYPGSASDQFAFQWYILAVEIVVTFLILMLICLPIRGVERLKPFAMCLLTYAFVLTTLQIQSLLFFKRTSAANQLYGKGRIRWTLAGAIAGAVLNGLSLLFLSLLREPHRQDKTLTTKRGKRVASDHTGHDTERTTGPAMV